MPRRMPPCQHRLYQLDFWLAHGGGGALSCPLCEMTFVCSMEELESLFYPFTYTNPEGKDGDLTIFVPKKVFIK